MDNILLESIRALKKLNEEESVEAEEKELPAETEEEVNPSEEVTSGEEELNPGEEEIQSVEDVEAEDEEATIEEDIDFYKDVFAAWKESWDEEHDEPFPELTDEEFAQFAELANSIADTPIEEEGEEGEEDLEEDFNSSFPVQFLPEDQSRRFITEIPAADPSRPPHFFKLGYAKELGPEIPAKFRGGRGSEGNPFVRIIKCTEYSKLYTGADWRHTNATKAADKILGTERHTGEKTGFHFGAEDSIANRIGVYQNGKAALQAYIADNSVQKVKFFISLDNGDLHEATRDEVAQYLTPAWAGKVLNPSTARTAAGVNAETGEAIYDKPINRFYLDRIYMIGNLGHSLF